MIIFKRVLSVLSIILAVVFLIASLAGIAGTWVVHKSSPGGKWDALIRNYNLVLRDRATKGEVVLSRDGSEVDYYTFDSITWAPDSKKLVAMRLRRGYLRVIRYVESSPADQLQP